MTKAEEQEFAVPVLHGPRFHDHSLPLEVVRELEAYQRLILDVAKALFLARHPGRKRVPKNFEEGLNLTLRKVEPGSAMPVLLRTRPPATQPSLLPAGPDDFERARDLIADAVAAVERGTTPPSPFPRSMLGRFNIFGRTLRPDEAIELRSQRDKPGPKYNRSLRRKLVLMAETSFSDRIDLIGTIHEADVDRRVFHFVSGGVKTPGSYSPAHEPLILAALKDHDRIQLRIVGTGSYDSHERLVRIEELDEVTLIEVPPLSPAAFRARLAELKTLSPGWLDGDTGEPFDGAALDSLGAILAELNEEEELPLPYLYPTPEGLVQAEWTVSSWEVSARFDLATGDAELDAVHPQSGAGREASANFKTAEGRLALVQFVAAFEVKWPR